MKNLENSALMQEMNVNEMQEVNGGWVALALAVAGAAIYRSEERRVGKECRSRWSPYH